MELNSTKKQTTDQKRDRPKLTLIPTYKTDPNRRYTGHWKSGL